MNDYIKSLKEAILNSEDIIYYCLVNPKDFNEHIMPFMNAAATINYGGGNFDNVFKIHTAQIIKSEKVKRGKFIASTDLPDPSYILDIY